jgi:Transposase DDE domain
VAAARDELERAGVDQSLDVVLADAGYWHEKQIERLHGEGIRALVAPQARNRTTPRRGTNKGWMGFMRRVLDSPAGRELYRNRSAMIEPVFANTKFNRRMDRFLRRGRAACRSEWRLMAATHNLLKLHSHLSAQAA